MFTPNGDSANDVFYIRCKKVDHYKCVIKNGWGTKLFESDDFNEGWDGTHNGNEVNDGSYKVIVEATLNGVKFEKEAAVYLFRDSEKSCPFEPVYCTFNNQFGDFGYDQ